MTAKATTAKKPANTADESIAMGKDAMEQMAKASNEGYEQAVEITREQVQKTSAAIMKGYDDLASLNKDGVDALMKAGGAFAKGVEDMRNAYAGFAKVSTEKSVEAAKAMMTAKTLQDLFELQSDYAKSTFDTLMVETTKLSEMSVKVTNEAFQPIKEQFDATVQKMTKATAA